MPDVDWQPDVLGPGYRRHELDLGADPDGEGSVAAVLVRREPADGEVTRGAVLYVHGFSDYFFQTELADAFAGHGLAFYGLDLRKCGRARRPGQTAHYVSDLALYDEELERALAIVADAHPGLPVIVAAHSTGGLIVALWLDRRRASGRVAPVTGLVLNSPWFDLQGTQIQRGALTQALRVLGRALPHREFKGPPGVYGQTLHVSGTGEWEFNLAWKPLDGFPVTLGWLNAIRRGHARLHRGLDVGVPSLILRSDRSDFSGQYTPVSDRADLVLDVTQIARWAGCLGGATSVIPVEGARHDVFLSAAEPRERAYTVLNAWLDQHLLETAISLGRQQHLEVTAASWRAADQDLSAVRPGDRPHQREAEAGAARMPAVTDEPLEHVGQQLGRYAAAGVGHGQPDIRRGRERQLDDVSLAGMPDGVLQERVHRQAEPLPVGVDDDLIELAELPVAVGGRPPPAQQLDDEAVQGDRLRAQEVGIPGRRDDQQPLGDPPQPAQLAQDDADVLCFLLAGQLAGQQLGVPERDGDRRAELMGGVLEEPALVDQQPLVLLADLPQLKFGRVLAPGVPDNRAEHRCHQRDLGHLSRVLGAAHHVDAHRRPGRRDHHGEHPEGGPGRPRAESVEQGEADPDGMEGNGVPAREQDNQQEAEHGEGGPRGIQPAGPERPPQPPQPGHEVSEAGGKPPGLAGSRGRRFQ
jgi:alpha-beta hydrolase superfamily lysophospholipase